MRGQVRAERAVHALTIAARHRIESVQAERRSGRHIPLRHENFRYKHFLTPSYLDYVARVSWADHAVSLETAACLLQMCEQWYPRRVLDTGSGYSSYVLRRYAAESGAEVVSVDDDETWMGETAAYLEQMKVGTHGLISWQQHLAANDRRPFDLIFHDLGTHNTRVQTMQHVSDLVAADGHLVYDDMQVDLVRAEARRITRQAGRRYFSMWSVTGDPIQRYAGLSVL